MSERGFFLAAYDVADERRLHASLQLVKAHALGGQKSAYECHLSAREATGLLHAIARVLEKEEDSFLLLRLDPRARPRV